MRTNEFIGPRTVPILHLWNKIISYNGTRPQDNKFSQVTLPLQTLFVGKYPEEIYFSCNATSKTDLGKGWELRTLCLLLRPLQAVTVGSAPSVPVLLTAWLTASTVGTTHGNSHVWAIFTSVSSRVKLHLQKLFKKSEFLMFLIKLSKFLNVFLFSFFKRFYLFA